MSTKPNMKKRMIIMVIALAIVFGGLVLYNVIKGILLRNFFAHYKPPAVTVSAVKAETKNWEPRIHAVGNFIATNGVDVNSQASGNVVNIHFNSGQYINKNQPLIDIDDSVEQALLKFNLAELTLKEINYKRQIDLFKRGATPSSSVDEAKANLQQAQANVQKIQAQITQKHITAPFSGQLGIRQVNLGQYITPGQTSIVSLQSLDPLYLEFYLPEQNFKNIHVGQTVWTQIEGYPEFVFTGKITAINSKVDPNTHNILVQATLPNCPLEAITTKNPSLLTIKKDLESQQKIVSCNTEKNNQTNVKRFIFLPGMFASVSIEQPIIPNVIVLPSTAISYSLYGNSVFIIEKTYNENKKEMLTVKRVFITTGQQRGNYTVIEKGLNPNQLVVSLGELKLENGTPVTIDNSIQLKPIEDPDQLGQ